MIGHDPCGKRWIDQRVIDGEPGPPIEHVCISAPGHAMEHRCRCHALHPS